MAKHFAVTVSFTAGISDEFATRRSEMISLLRANRECEYEYELLRSTYNYCRVRVVTVKLRPKIGS
jgi:hypothetical protein